LISSSLLTKLKTNKQQKQPPQNAQNVFDSKTKPKIILQKKTLEAVNFEKSDRLRTVQKNDNNFFV